MFGRTPPPPSPLSTQFNYQCLSICFGGCVLMCIYVPFVWVLIPPYECLDHELGILVCSPLPLALSLALPYETQVLSLLKGTCISNGF